MATKKSSSDYSESSIRVLKGLEPVKQRPGMYTRTENPLHIIQEVIDNASDEALGGFARHILVTLNTDGSVSVEDDGRGIPVGLHPEEKVPTVEIVFTRLHAGGKFDKGSGGAYSFSGGLHGVGVSVTNALSTRLEITVWREGKVHDIAFADGDVVEKLKSRAPGKDEQEIRHPGNGLAECQILRFGLDPDERIAAPAALEGGAAAGRESHAGQRQKRRHANLAIRPGLARLPARIAGAIFQRRNADSAVRGRAVCQCRRRGFCRGRRRGLGGGLDRRWQRGARILRQPDPDFGWRHA